MEGLEPLIRELMNADWTNGERLAALLLALGHPPGDVASRIGALLDAPPSSDFGRALVGANPDAPPDALLETLFDLVAAEHPRLGHILREVYSARHADAT